jgi:hypothetical protein
VKVLLDAQLSHEIAELLVQRGHDAEAVTSRTDLANSTPDAQLMEIAHAEGRVIVTNNIKDFRPIAAQRIASGQGHSGLVLISPNTPRTRAATKHLADAIERALLANPDGLAGSERWI